MTDQLQFGIKYLCQIIVASGAVYNIYILQYIYYIIYISECITISNELQDGFRWKKENKWVQPYVHALVHLYDICIYTYAI